MARKEPLLSALKGEPGPPAAVRAPSSSGTGLTGPRRSPAPLLAF